MCYVPDVSLSWRNQSSHISSPIPVTLDPLQFAYRPNRSTDDVRDDDRSTSLTYSTPHTQWGYPPSHTLSSFKYLGVNISEDLTWTTHIETQVKKARRRLYHLRQLRKFRVSPTILKTFYSGTIESVLTQCISVWYGNSSSQDCKALQRVVRLAERISGSALPSLQDIYLKRCRSRAVKIIKDSNHPGNCLFTLLPSGKRFRCLMTKTERLRRSFFPQAIRLLNSTQPLNIIMTSLINHSQSVRDSLFSTSYWQCHLHTALSVFWHFYFFGIAATWQPCTTCLHIPLLYIPAYLTAYCHAHSFIFYILVFISYFLLI